MKMRTTWIKLSLLVTGLLSSTLSYSHPGHDLNAFHSHATTDLLLSLLLPLAFSALIVFAIQRSRKTRRSKPAPVASENKTDR